jgi:hypothetical protein
VQVSYPRVEVQRRVDPRRVFCGVCEHSEFVHGDFEPRTCLYAGCACSGYTAQVAITIVLNDDRRD